MNQSFYQRVIAPSLIAFACGLPVVTRLRKKLLQGLSGRVLEIGVGAGANVSLLPWAVDVWLGVEPSLSMRERAEKKAKRHYRPIEWVEGTGEKMSLASGSVDHVVVSFTLCSVEDPAKVMAEARRVVRTGGELRLLEHSLAPDSKIAKWQHRLNNYEQRFVGGCQLTRVPVDYVNNSKWMVVSVEKFYAGIHSPWSFITQIRAIAI